jgi:hypothetical protein
MLAALSDAICRRADGDNFDLDWHVTHPEAYRPDTAQERVIWDELTDPANYRALRRYVLQWSDHELDDYARGFYGLLLKSARQRRGRAAA